MPVETMSMPHPKSKAVPSTSPAEANPRPDLLAEDPRLHPVMQLAQICDFESGHGRHVTFLALRLFDQLQPLHQLGAEERFWLQAASLLHDIGWVEGWRSHHKTTLRIILSTPMLPFSSKERLIIGSIARYHRKGLPKATHDNYAALPPATQKVTSILASFLRLADGLDQNHRGLVSDLTCRIADDKITVLCTVTEPADDELAAAAEKSDLLHKVYKKKIAIVRSQP
jgi:exopolyphosphatase/pppGpp-phosphohydrolase